MMTTDRLYDDAELAQFYDLENDWADDQAFCFNLAKDASSVLDLGCGTGRLAARIAEAYGMPVTGVDPAAPMLDIARKRSGGDKVDWVQGDARQLQLGHRFDLVVLTGHAFQVFLTSKDRLALLRSITAHLNPAGRFIFDSRNPLREEWHEWQAAESERQVTHPTLGTVKAWNEAEHDAATGIVTYRTHYRVLKTGQHHAASSRIAFPPQGEIARLIEQAGLVVDRWLGDWQGSACTPTSREIIPLGRKR
jgi:ubiquinone/menaquinone biosynthesis C-methylase UbiE